MACPRHPVLGLKVFAAFGIANIAMLALVKPRLTTRTLPLGANGGKRMPSTLGSPSGNVIWAVAPRFAVYPAMAKRHATFSLLLVAIAVGC